MYLQKLALMAQKLKSNLQPYINDTLMHYRSLEKIRREKIFVRRHVRRKLNT